MLQEFLDANLLPITEESYFEKIKKTADELAKKLSKNKAKVLSYTLIALDPDVPADNPDVIEVKELITKNWSTFLTNSKDTPITFIRAVMLEALQIVSNETSTACLIWLTGRNIYQYFKIIGKEKDLITKFLLSLGRKIENAATENWSLPSEAKLQKLSVEIKEIVGVVLDKAEVEAQLKAASIHSGWGQGGENPHTQAQNNINWPLFFSERASQGLTDSINKVFKKQEKSISENQILIQEAVNKLLSQTQSEILERNYFLQMRTQILWWKESCYSVSLNQSYRGQQNGLVQILLANDYSFFIPTIYPTSADYFLKETHRSLVKDESKNESM
ncbi:MAG: hypothetical protein IPP96_09455 [Chitinophagaceae bacterium]|nr:hypothetical protein [Chitinophagaceae bacterium]